MMITQRGVPTFSKSDSLVGFCYTCGQFCSSVRPLSVLPVGNLHVVGVISMTSFDSMLLMDYVVVKVAVFNCYLYVHDGWRRILRATHREINISYPSKDREDHIL